MRAAAQAPASASPAPVTSVILRGAGGLIAKASLPSKASTALAPLDRTARLMPRPRSLPSMSSAFASRPSPVSAAASRVFRNRQARSPSTPASRAAFAGEMAMAKIGFPAVSFGMRASASAERLASQNSASAVAYRLAHRRPAKLLGEGKVVEPHVGKRRDHVAASVEKRRVARRRAVEEGHGKIADTGGRDCPRHRFAGRVAAAHRHHPAFHAAPRGVAQAR